MQWKKVVEGEYEWNKGELEKDFIYLEDQLKFIESNRNKYEEMGRRLEKYEHHLSEQDWIHD